jgi:DNA-binding response OmpR family regulator
MRVLIIEQDQKLGCALAQDLQAELFAVDLALDSSEGLLLAAEGQHDLIILDIAFSHTDSLRLLQRLRSKQGTVPILILLERGNGCDPLEGLKHGADSYVLKPFSCEELLTHIRVLLRRPGKLAEKLKVGELELDSATHTVTRNGNLIPLTQREYHLLEYLMRNAERPVTRSMVIEHVWHSRFDGLNNIVDVYINHLRLKIDRGFHKKLIHTVRGAGYMLVELETEPPYTAAA